MRKSRMLASQNQPKIMPKRPRKRCPNKHAIFPRFLLEKASVARAPTSISYWFFQYFCLSDMFLQIAFGMPFSYQKRTKNPSKTMSEPLKNRCQKLVVFQHRFFGLSASISEPLGPPSPPRCLQRQAC